MNQDQPAHGCDVVSSDAGGDTRGRINRRVVMKASAALSAIALVGGIGASTGLPARRVAAAQNGGTRAGSFVPGDQGATFNAASAGDFAQFQTDFPFYALGANWENSVGSWPIVEVQISVDGDTWSDTYQMAENHEDGGRPTRDNRLFTPLIFTNGEQYVRYRTVDSNGNPGAVTGLSFTYIDATDGPWAADVDAALASSSGSTFSTADTGDDRVPPTVVTREEWGADESWRYDSVIGQIWPPEYQTVEHVIIHHTDTSTAQDPIVAIRSIYYYHAVDQGWGDIGYNYLVDKNGRIYEGRYGGQNVIGGHSYEYANGSSGISIIGDYENAPPSDASLAGLVAITAWAARDLDPYGRSDFLEAPDLPTICAHRDVNSTTCPGDELYVDVPEVRSLVAATLNAGDLNSSHPAGIAVRDRITVRTDDGGPLNLRSNAGTQYSVVAQLKNGTTGTVIDGPVSTSSANWYKIQSGSTSGWVDAQYLIVTPSPPPASGQYVFGQNVQFTGTTNVRTQPTTSSGILVTVSASTDAFILAGPLSLGNNSWYQIRTENEDDGWVVAANLKAVPVNTKPSAKFSVGDTVEATEQINIRPRPGISQTVTASTWAGNDFEITVAPLGINGYIWYGVYGSFGGGWVVENYLSLVKSGGSTPPSSGNNKFANGNTVQVTDSLNFRTSPGTSASVIAVLDPGTTLTVVGGPTSASGYTWYQLRTSGGTTGWAVQDYLTKSGGTAPSNKFAKGNTVQVTETLNFRSSAGTSASVISQLSPGTTLTVVGGPTSANGYTWYQLRTSGGTTGWAAQDWLAKTTSTTPPSSGSNKFANGNTVQVTESLNFRTSAGTSASVITVLDPGATLTVVGGPTSANGYTWYQLRSSGGTTGWAVQDYLTKTGGAAPTNNFAKGNTVQVTESLNFRSSAGTSASVIAVLNPGTNLTVTGGPTSANGYTWYQLRTSGGTTGWSVQDYLKKV